MKLFAALALVLATPLLAQSNMPPSYWAYRQLPDAKLMFSPRVGFNWNPGGEDRNQVRGNVGIFTGPPPFIMLGNAFANNGLGLVTLLCSRPNTTTRPAAFVTDVSQLPRSCGTAPNPARGAAGTAGINITDPDFKYPQNFVTTAGFDRVLPYDFIFTFEAMYRKAINGLAVVDRNLRGPRMVGGQISRDPNGRVYYADSITTNCRPRRCSGSIGRGGYCTMRPIDVTSPARSDSS